MRLFDPKFFVYISFAFMMVTSSACARRGIGAVFDSPTCGNGVIDPGEECDDGNNISGDGCSADCLLEEPAAACLITLDGESPTQISSTRIGKDGSLQSVDSVILDWYEKTSEMRNEAVSACGRNVYVVPRTKNSIIHLIVHHDGSLELVDEVLTSNETYGLVADCDAGLLFVSGRDKEDHNRDAFIATFGLGSEGELTPLTVEALNMGNNSSMGYSIVDLSIQRHPVSRELWVTAAIDDLEEELISVSWRLGYDNEGEVTVIEKRDEMIPHLDGHHSARFTPDGSKYVVADGSDLRWFDLDEDYRLPLSTEQQDCNQDHLIDPTAIELSQGDNVFYAYGKNSALNAGELLPGCPLSQTKVSVPSTDSRGRIQLKLAYDDTILVAMGANGNITTYSTGSDGLTLDQIDTITLSQAENLESGVIIPCY